MSSCFRSEEMCLVQLFFQTESAHNCINELGHLGLVQFKDLNPGTTSYQRRFVNEVKKCEDMERIIRFLRKEMKKTNIFVAEALQSDRVPGPRDTAELETTFTKLEKELKEINSNREVLRNNIMDLLEMSYLLHMTEEFFDETKSRLSCSELPSEDSIATYSRVTSRRTSRCSASGPLNLRFVAGVIRQERIPAFEKVLWRVFHGNFVLRHAEIQPPEESPMIEDLVKKDVFIVFVQGDQAKGKMKKICDGFHASMYPCPDTANARKDMRNSVNTRIEDLQMVLKRAEDYKESVLTVVAAHLEEWRTKVKKMKAIYYTLNLCNTDITQKIIVAEIWCAVSDLNKVQSALIKASKQSGSSLHPVLNRIHTQQTPPTFNRVNTFTAGFQSIINAYGVGDYQEINPAPYTIVTFPFLFAVMFGDCGHGLLMAVLAVWIIFQEEKFKELNNELINVLVNGRYIVLLMGIFSIYTGFIYNDCFSKSLNIFGSAWRVNAMFGSSGPWTNETLLHCEHLQLDPLVPGVYSGTPYPFGIDPIWSIATNKLSFLNSYKMKMSVIVGVVHMLFGITLSFLNYIYFKNAKCIFLRFIPELVFMLSLFGYLLVLIFFKWCVALQPDTAPSILILFVDMMLFAYDGPGDAMLFHGQKAVQIFLVVLAFLMVPWLLLVKPLFIYREHKTAKQQVLTNKVPLEVFRNSGYSDSQNDQCAAEANAFTSDNNLLEKVSLGDVLVYQAIHTIEFCLGCISNTASYLRLWALSLAHAELSEVLWNMVLRAALTITSDLGSVLVVVLFAGFAIFTVAILLIMEGLSAFLHALRLHWYAPGSIQSRGVWHTRS